MIIMVACCYDNSSERDTVGKRAAAIALGLRSTPDERQGLGTSIWADRSLASGASLDSARGWA